MGCNVRICATSTAAPLLSCLSPIKVIAPHLSARLESLSGQQLPQLVRGAAEQVLRTSQLEGQLLEQLFGTAVTAQRPPQAYGVQTQGELILAHTIACFRPLLNTEICLATVWLVLFCITRGMHANWKGSANPHCCC
jgi:hypothetical protein